MGVVKDYLLVIEDKAALDKHIKLDDKNCISIEVNAVRDYAVNGALFYAKHLARNTTYKKSLRLVYQAMKKSIKFHHYM